MAKKPSAKKLTPVAKRKPRNGRLTTSASEDPPTMLLQLRLPEGVVAKIDVVRNKELIPPSRHRWIIEAIAAKLKAQVEEFHVTFP